MQLLLWSVGPVQDFIATARRTLDLWYGSHLLSEVSRAAARRAVALGAVPLLPSEDALLLEDAGVPNKVLLQLFDDHDPSEVAREMGLAAWERLSEDAAKVFAKVESQHRGPFDRGDADDQLEDLLERSWAATPITGSFRDARRRVEHLLAATKAHRAFSPPTWGSAKPKSSMDGAREAVIDLRKAPHRVRLALGILDQEVLDGVGLLKRVGPRVLEHRGRLPSVSAAAAYPFLEAADRHPHAHAAWTSYLRDLPDPVSPDARAADLPLIGRYDPHLLYPTRLHERWPDPDQRRTAERALRAFLGAVRSDEHPAPSVYYALLLADGDHMGAVLDAVDDAEHLRQVGDWLVSFSTAVADVVGSHRGHLVYAGGDDVLAFVPVDHALEAADALRRLYRDRVGAPARAQLPDGAPTTTLSVGIAIVHHLEPLADALGHARQAEKDAKHAGRNAWCIRRVARAGTALAVQAQWGDEDSPYGTLGTLVDAFRVGRLTRGLPYDLRTAAERLLGPEQGREARAPDEATDGALAKHEARRILAQKDVPKDLTELIVGQVDSLSALCKMADRLILARALTGRGGDA